jgi:hypothetical protein
VKIESFCFGVEANSKSTRRKMQKPQERKLTVLASGAFFRLEARLLALCIIAGVRQSRELVEWKATSSRICDRSTYAFILSIT